jgi:hypothetical protein
VLAEGGTPETEISGHSLRVLGKKPRLGALGLGGWKDAQVNATRVLSL